MEKAARLAEDLCAKMKCHSVYISLASDECLFPFDMSEPGNVNSDGIVGYMGLPTPDETGHSFGAICASTTAPRARTQTDQMMLSNTASETQAVRATAGLRHENQVLSVVLGGYDDIKGAIAKPADALISIHAKSGTLICVTNVLLHRIDPCGLEKQVSRALKMTKSPGFGTEKSGSFVGMDCAKKALCDPCCQAIPVH